MTFWQNVVRFQKEKVDPWIALRNTVGVALPLLAGLAANRMAGALAMSIGALNVSYSDSHAPYSQRGRRMFAASVVVSVAVFAGAFCGAYHFIAVPFVGAWSLAAGMLVVLSPSAADLGVMSLVTVVVYSARPLPLPEAAAAGLLAFAGGLLQTMLALLLWPIRRYLPQRRALARLYFELADAAAVPVEVQRTPRVSIQSTEAQTALAALEGDHSVESERYRMILSQAERTRLGLFALMRVRSRAAREIPETAERALLDRYLEIAAHVLNTLGKALEGAPPVPLTKSLTELQAVTDELRKQCVENASPLAVMMGDARAQMDAITGQLRAAAEKTSAATPEGLEDYARQETRKPWRFQLAGALATLRANLSLDSAASRHAIRLAVCVAAGDSLARGLHLSRSYWLPMTIAIVLRPDFTATFTRGVLRLAGTFVGLVFATALFHVIPTSAAAQVAAVAALTFALRCWGPANYGILVAAVTSIIVLLIAMLGVPPGPVMLARGLNTAIGGCLALLVYWLWPTWERTQVPEQIALMLDAYRQYFRTIRMSYVNPAVSLAAELDQARLAARLTRSNLEASIDRLAAEPGASRLKADTLAAVLATSHRFIHSVMALEAGIAGSPAAPARPDMHRFADDVEKTLFYLAAALRGSTVTRDALPDLREDHHALVSSGSPLEQRHALVNVETDRIANSLNTLSEEVFKSVVLDLSLGTPT